MEMVDALRDSAVVQTVRVRAYETRAYCQCAHIHISRRGIPIYLVSVFIGCATARDKRSYLCLCYKIDSAKAPLLRRYIDPYLERNRYESVYPVEIERPKI